MTETAKSDDIEYYSISSEQTEDCLYTSDDDATEDYSVGLWKCNMTKAILIHNPAPNTAAIIKYVADKYGLVCDDPQQIKQLIELAKLANKYAIAYRMHIVRKIC